MRILIAEDDQDIQRLLTLLLEHWGHEVIVANDGLQAWKILQNTPIQFLISDWMIPEINGIELCRKIRATHFSGYIYIILLTAADNSDDIVTCIEAGANDYVAKPFNNEKLRVRIEAGLRVLRLESDLTERNAYLTAAYDTIQRDMEAAAKMQRSLLPAPSATLGIAHFDWLFLPALFVAGDILNYFRILDSHHVAFYLLDVSGHGVPSSMLSFTLSKILSPNNANNLLKAFGVTAPGSVSLVPPEKVIADLNQAFQGGTESDLYFTMIYAVLDTNTGKLQFCQAGHPPPILLPAGKSAALLGNGGFPVGMLPDIIYDMSLITLQTGDRFFIYSDGVTECANADNEEYGEQRLMKFLESVRNLPMSEINTALKETLVKWHGNEEFYDDVSFLGLEMK